MFLSRRITPRAHQALLERRPSIVVLQMDLMASYSVILLVLE